ncbi:uncharacterized protein Z519_05325 [Cladophialophora bantiana CBS 173.52]|uniref:Uncharacterized protein n=1 Tax=Cladophialophora bantiana (strain ATCC 10958 / CBS 173.52 / CDC B-1940 / NIH 8579) TaxID=1442370 RepID=A0A0D2IB44_CLAB1|nr:uncharacterized protein Z519_05325 [Cladophialophora bantiana CBS 173.52]KIW94009.1 hypothetical protein Z519_05325 [Cladophialophora bantiana CBS 173.52]
MPGDRRRWFLQRLGSVLRLPANTPHASWIGSGGAEGLHPTPPAISAESAIPTEPVVPVEPVIHAEPPQPPPSTSDITHPPSDLPINVTIEDVAQLDKCPTATPLTSVLWLRGVENIDQFQKALDDSYKGDLESDSSLGEVMIFGEDAIPDGSNPLQEQSSCSTRDTVLGTGQDGVLDRSPDGDGGSDISGAPGSKGFSALFDTGAQVSVIPLKTLRRLKKGFTKFSHLHPDLQSQMALGDFRGQKHQPLGLVPLLWSLDAFPSVIFNTTFWVVDGNTENDLIIGKDVMRDAYIAIKKEKKFRNKDPRTLIKNAIHGSVGILRKVSKGNLRGAPGL